MKCNVILLVAGLMMLGCGKSAEEEAAGPSGTGDEKGAKKGVVGLYGDGDEKLHLKENGAATMYNGDEEIECIWKIVDGELHLTPMKGFDKELKSIVHSIADDGGLKVVAMIGIDGKRHPNVRKGTLPKID